VLAGTRREERIWDAATAGDLGEAMSVAAYLNSWTSELDLRNELKRALGGGRGEVPKVVVTQRYLTPLEYDLVLRAHCGIGKTNGEQAAVESKSILRSVV
jgi:hypothetical protein